MTTPSPREPLLTRGRAAAAVAVAAVALSYAAYTGHTWEDYYITYKPAKNLVEGQGLVFQPGQRVHSFTSPINVLLPALFAFATGDRSDQLVLWLFRVASAAALGLGVALLVRAGSRLGFGRGAQVALAALFCAEAKIIAFSSNGQEAGFMVLFLGATLDALAADDDDRWRLGLAVAGLQWTRPDAFLYAVALVGSAWLFGAVGAPFRGRAGIRRLFSSALVALAVYSPWLVFSAWYYGSPVPHTVVAKQLHGHGDSLRALADGLAAYPLRLLEGKSAASQVYLPIYSAGGGWPGFFYVPFAAFVGALCALYWVLPFAQPRSRAMSLAFMLCDVYLIAVVPYLFPWYLPNAGVVGLFALACIGQDVRDLAGFLEGRGALAAGQNVRRLAAAAGALVVGLLGAIELGTFQQIRLQQALIEDGGRKQIGLWLKANARSPRDTVFLEPLGYIGYFSRLKMYDFPGLSSPEVVAARRRLGTDRWAPLIRDLKPDWLVLRPVEAEDLLRDDPALLRNDYAMTRVFDAMPAIERLGDFPGKPMLVSDARFVVFARR